MQAKAHWGQGQWGDAKVRRRPPGGQGVAWGILRGWPFFHPDTFLSGWNLLPTRALSCEVSNRADER
jgi:hypothetical protein